MKWKFWVQLIVDILFLLGLTVNIVAAKNVTVVFILLLIFSILTFIIHRKIPIKGMNSKDVMIISTCLSLGFMMTVYFIGIFLGYEKIYTSIFNSYIPKSRILFVLLIILITEFIRGVLAQGDYSGYRKGKFLFLINILMFTIIDVSLATKAYSLKAFDELYEFCALVLLPSASKNVLLTYIAGKDGINSNIIYRLIMDFHIYIIPFITKTNEFIYGVALLVLPYVIYMMVYEDESQKELKPALKKKNHLGNVLTIVIFGLFIVLVSREFKYSLIGVGSESMTGTFNKGDAIVYTRYKDINKKLEIGDIIVFNKEGKMILHRINDMYLSSGKVIYITKGDFNETVDNWVVTDEEIVGLVNFRIHYIAWPSVILSELF